ncbi:YiiD C-terminal domain-containing protein [Bythopirellula goksoeyrii]|uniref:Thioesterase (YiiD_Cterm) n=1 Tax=Bythopirellula goksoeyrii TaxID=1400387 RepID=A0A5B9Q3J6_9BACT|nr:YiiD C-terminal domain-containing protein [Bythopirellula goksoeyrii]QEG33547.1 Putative thioesterase (yiiD_Cterm) [Bythopirellula goksoeyrii]
MTDPLIDNLQQTLHREMPITKAMGITVHDWDGQRLAMQMPLEPNRNHQYSAFAGSLNALCTAVGWGTVVMLLESQGLTGNVVIRRGKIRYLRPVRTPLFIAKGLPIDPEELEYFYALQRSKGKTKIDISATIADDAGPYVSFTGAYVVQE